MALGLWIVMLVCNLILPLTFIGMGQKFTKDPPKTIDPMYGYRTVMSMKNQDTWEFAQQRYGRTCCKIGWVLLPVTALFLLLMRTLRVPVESMDFCFCQVGFVLLEAVAVVIANYVPVERALKQNFDKNGNRR